jgi:hypothetical protein
MLVILRPSSIERNRARLTGFIEEFALLSAHMIKSMLSVSSTGVAILEWTGLAYRRIDRMKSRVVTDRKRLISLYKEA